MLQTLCCRRLWIIVVMCFVIGGSAMAQQVPVHLSEQPLDGSPARALERARLEASPRSAQPAMAPSASRAAKEWTNVEIMLSGFVLAFGALVSILQTVVIVMAKRAWSPKDILRLNALTLIITGSLVLITAGYSAEQIAPVMGLLGSIGGYLLGSGDDSQGKAIAS